MTKYFFYWCIIQYIHTYPNVVTGSKSIERFIKSLLFLFQEEEDYSDSCTSLLEQKEWWWEHLQVNKVT